MNQSILLYTNIYKCAKVGYVCYNSRKLHPGFYVLDLFNAVSKGKGLEFPVVFLAELDSSFNKKDIQADILTDTDCTLGLQVIDQNSKSKLRSLAHEVIAEQKHSTALAEEMRILYVAATRARERLILVASQKQKTCSRIISNGYFFGDAPIPDW